LITLLKTNVIASKMKKDYVDAVNVTLVHVTLVNAVNAKNQELVNVPKMKKDYVAVVNVTLVNATLVSVVNAKKDKNNLDPAVKNQNKSNQEDQVVAIVLKKKIKLL